MFEKNYHLHWIAGRTNTLSKYMIHIFLILGVAFVTPFLCYFQKLWLLAVKKVWSNFSCNVLLYLWAQKVCLRFLKSHFKLEISIIFVLLGVFVSIFIQLKSSFSGKKKHQWWNLMHTFVERLSKIDVAKY